jgi:hypothetical protein
MNFKPELLPNNKAGEPLDIETVIANPREWLYSNKLDGARVEIFGTGPAKGRSLKIIPNVHIQRMVKDIQLVLQLPECVVIEAEFYSPDMNFAEIMHFFRSEDVTSDKSVKKYEALMRNNKWPFPGRDVKWATSWHKSLKLHVFNVVNIAMGDTTFLERKLYADMIFFGYETKMNEKNNTNSKFPSIDINKLELDMIQIVHRGFEHIDNLYQAYDQAILDGYEGLVVRNLNALYKQGRQTLKSNTVYKLKNDDVEFDGVILSVEEGTVAREGAQKTVNELGRSKTSQLKEDRVLSGMAKGFKVRMDDGRELTVSLKGYDHEDRKNLLRNPTDFVGETIRFTGMLPVKPGGMPRHAHYTKGNIRDAK